MTNAPAQVIAGYVRISRQMLDDVPAMTSFLQARLLEKYLVAEDAQLLSGSGSGGSAGAAGYASGGGGGWGSSGGSGNVGAGSGGKAVNLNGKSVTFTSGNTTRVYGAVS